MKKRTDVLVILIVFSVLTLNAAISIGLGIAVDSRKTDVRSTDAASAIFVYLLNFEKWLNPDDSGDNSWQKWFSDGKWPFWKYQHTADQVEGWLGMKTGRLFLENINYKEKAYFIKRNLSLVFYDS